MATLNDILKIDSTIFLKPEKDELYRKEISDKNKLINKLENELRSEKIARNRLSVLDAQSRGVEPAYISSIDLKMIIEDLLENKLSASKTFERHEVNEGMGVKWAERIIKKPVDKDVLSLAINYLTKNTNLILMNKYEVLDVKDIARSASYSAALTKLKKQQGIAHALQDKDNQLINKDSVIAAKDVEIEKLKTELQRNKSEDWKPQAIALKQAGISVTKIAERLSKSRTLVSTYLNSPGVKYQALD